MPNIVEDVLSVTADAFEKLVRDDRTIAPEFIKLLKNGQTPYVFRLLDNTIPGGYMLMVRVEPQPT